MSTKRQMIRRGSKPPRITPEMVDLFIRCKKLGPIYRECITPPFTCRSSDESKHCLECREYLDASGGLHSMLGRNPWQENVCFTIGDDEPPDWMRGDARRSAEYRQAVAIRRELERLADAQQRYRDLAAAVDAEDRERRAGRRSSGRAMGKIKPPLQF